MITITKTHTIISCNEKGCKTPALKVEGVRSRRKGYVLAIEKDWRWKDAKTHFCPDHKPANLIAKKVEKAAPKKAEKKVVKPVVTKKVETKKVSQPVRLGHSAASFSGKSKKTVRK